MMVQVGYIPYSASDIYRESDRKREEEIEARSGRRAAAAERWAGGLLAAVGKDIS